MSLLHSRDVTRQATLKHLCYVLILLFCCMLLLYVMFCVAMTVQCYAGKCFPEEAPALFTGEYE